ncbi:carbonyl reductase family member 4 isoform 1-T1 [Pholidichthys leucotaenia]
MFSYSCWRLFSSRVSHSVSMRANKMVMNKTRVYIILLYFLLNKTLLLTCKKKNLACIQNTVSSFPAFLKKCTQVKIKKKYSATKATSYCPPPSVVDHVAFSCDVSKEQDVQKTFETIHRSCGGISYLVNAAAINRDSLLLRTKAEDMVALLHTNLLGSMLTCRAALRSMLHAKEGAIINIGSVVGLKGNSGQCVYSATKAGLEGFTRSLAKEVASRNIRVNLLAPGFIRTDMTAELKEEDRERSIPLRRFGEPEEVAQAALFLLDSPYITGQVLVVDGGLHLAM